VNLPYYRDNGGTSIRVENTYWCYVPQTFSLMDLMDLNSLHDFALDRVDLETRRLKFTRSKMEEVSKLAFRPI
jgi:hypothetical protein